MSFQPETASQAINAILGRQFPGLVLEGPESANREVFQRAWIQLRDRQAEQAHTAAMANIERELQRWERFDAKQAEAIKTQTAGMSSWDKLRILAEDDPQNSDVALAMEMKHKAASHIAALQKRAGLLQSDFARSKLDASTLYQEGFSFWVDLRMTRLEALRVALRGERGPAMRQFVVGALNLSRPRKRQIPMPLPYFLPKRKDILDELEAEAKKKKEIEFSQLLLESAVFFELAEAAKAARLMAAAMEVIHDPENDMDYFAQSLAMEEPDLAEEAELADEFEYAPSYTPRFGQPASGRAF